MPEWKLYLENKEPFVVDPERWRWEVHYTDGFVLKQYDDNWHFHPFADIDQTRPIHAVYMVHDEHTPIIIFWKPGYKLIHFYTKNIIRMQSGVDESLAQKEFVRIYVFGYQCGNVRVMLAIMPDNAVILIDDVNRLEVE